MGTAPAEQSVDGRRLRWEAHKRERRQQIIDAAIEVIEDHPVGAEVHVHQIAERAGIARPAVYRHFTDRADLDRAVQRRVINLLLADLSPERMLHGTIREVIERITGTYVGWADAHTALHRAATRDAGGGEGAPLRAAVASVVQVIRPLLAVGAETLGATLDEEDEDALDLLVYALVSEAVGAVRLWLSRPERKPGAEALASRLSEVIWYQIDGLARARGLSLDPNLSIDEIVSAAFGATPAP